MGHAGWSCDPILARASTANDVRTTLHAYRLERSGNTPETRRIAAVANDLARVVVASVGSAFLVRDSEEAAKQWLLLVELAARARGLGRQLVEECSRFARRAGYRRIRLWTNDVLLAARKLYAGSGYRLIAEEPHRSFGKHLVG